jgi:DNA-binding transcriptional regulator/RsmH inhibitor MraZ
MPGERGAGRLSQKNQLTLRKDARALNGVRQGDVVVAKRHAPVHASGECFQAIAVMTEARLEEQTEAIRLHPTLSVAEKETAIINLNGDAHWLGVDAQNRVVLPQELVQWLHLQRDVVQFSTGSVVLLWHPDEWQRWKAVDAAWQPPQPPEDVPGVLLL